MRIHVGTEIEAPRSRVWSEVEDIAHHVDWMSDAESIRFETEGHQGVGTRFRVKTRLGLLRTVDTMTVTEWVEGEAIGVEHSGAVRGTGRITLDDMGDRTSITWDEELRLPAWFGGRVGEIVAKPVLTRIWRKNLGKLKELLESRPAADDPSPSGPGDPTGTTPEEAPVEAPTEPPPTPGALIGHGRDGDIREFGPGKVIRTTHDGRDLSREKAVMKWAADHGYPVPRVYDHDDPAAIVMDRLDGPSMLEDLGAHPWRSRRHARLLGRLHLRLAEIEAPDFLEHVAPGNSLLHLDFHPENVILTPEGPRVIDWANAAAGPGDLDAAFTWVLLKTGHVGGNIVMRTLTNMIRDRFANWFLDAAGGKGVLRWAVEAAELRMLDPHIMAGERDDVFKLARRLRGEALPLGTN